MSEKGISIDGSNSAKKSIELALEKKPSLAKYTAKVFSKVQGVEVEFWNDNKFIDSVFLTWKECKG